MIYSLLVLSPPTSSATARTAAAFAQAVITRGHSIHRVFFMDAGVYNGSVQSVFPQDELNPVNDWDKLHTDHNVELLLCVSSALKRGILDETEANRYEQTAANIHPAFVIGGLGQLVDATAQSDRLITFGG